MSVQGQGGFLEDVTPKLLWGEINWATERRGQRRVPRERSLVCKVCVMGKSMV